VHLLAFPILVLMLLVGFPLERVISFGPKLKLGSKLLVSDSRGKAIFNLIMGPFIAMAAAYTIAAGLAQSRIICMLPRCGIVSLGDHPAIFWFSVGFLFVAGCAAFSLVVFWGRWLRRHQRT
jgi:hypothetical protein